MSDHQVYLANCKSFYLKSFAKGQAARPITTDPNDIVAILVLLTFASAIVLFFISMIMVEDGLLPKIPDWLKPAHICSALLNIPTSLFHRFSQIRGTAALTTTLTALRSELSHQKTIAAELERTKALSDTNYRAQIRSLTRSRTDQIHRLNITSHYLTAAQNDLITANQKSSALEQTLKTRDTELTTLRQENDTLRQSLAAAKKETATYNIALQVLSASNWQVACEKKEVEKRYDGLKERFKGVVECGERLMREVEVLGRRCEELERVNANWVRSFHALHPRPVVRVLPPSSSSLLELGLQKGENPNSVPVSTQPFLPLTATSSSTSTSTSTPTTLPALHDRVASLERLLADRDWALSNKDAVIKNLRDDIVEYKGEIEWRDELIECNEEELEEVHWRLGFLQGFADDMSKGALWEGRGFEEGEEKEEVQWGRGVESGRLCDEEEEEECEEVEGGFEVVSVEDYTSV